MYENLKQHLNPHFFLIRHFTQQPDPRDQAMASDFLEKMSKVYRYILKTGIMKLCHCLKN